MGSCIPRVAAGVIHAVVMFGCESTPAEAPLAPAVPAPSVAATPAPGKNSASTPAVDGFAKSALPAAAPPAGAVAPDIPLTAGVTEVKRDGVPAVLVAVRAARNEGFDRVAFEFREHAPGHHIEYIDEPVRDCGAGDVKPIAGDGWLEVRMSPARAHTEEGQPTVAERELQPELPIVAELERTCDFEAVVTWVIGVRSPNRYRAFELAEPRRLVVDIVH